MSGWRHAGRNHPLDTAGREHAEYTSASLTTRGRAAWTHGRLEARAKVPSGRGTWPAIWTLGTNTREVGWPAGGEIDILEYVGHDPGVVHANVHTRGYNHARGNGRGARRALPDAEQTFHVYAVEWTPQGARGGAPPAAREGAGAPRDVVHRGTHDSDTVPARNRDAPRWLPVRSSTSTAHPVRRSFPAWH